jgi:hypothetical protein
MSRNDRSRQRARFGQGEEASRPDRPYAIGYGRPPIASRFKPGVSGNVRGRPKHSKNLKTRIREAMTANITIQEGANSRRVSKIEGVVLRQLQSALKGDDKSAMAIIKMATQLGFLDDPAGGPAEAAALSAAEERILAEMMSRHRPGKRR